MRVVTSMLILAAIMGSLPAQDAPRRDQPWDPAIVDAFRRVPVQEAGRVKPLDTAVSFLLLRLNGKRSVTTPEGEELDQIYGERSETVPEGEKLSPMEWALDCMFYPQQAGTYRVFQIQTSDVLDALELSDSKLMDALGLSDSQELDDLGLSKKVRKKRDRYSYAALAAVRDRLVELGRSYSAIEVKDRNLVQGQIVHLFHGFVEYELLTHSLDFARGRIGVSGVSELESTFGARSEVRFSQLLDASGALRQAALGDPHGGGPGASAADAVLRRMNALAEAGRYFAFFPPPSSDQEEWLSVRDLFLLCMMAGPQGGGSTALAPQIAALGHLEALCDDLGDPDAFARDGEAFRQSLASLAEARGEYAKIGLEVSFYEGDYFFRSLLGFLISFVLVSLSWLFAHSRVLNLLSWLAMLASTGLLVTGIVVRCILRSRPPVSTLYETILFITAVVAIVTLVIEAIGRKRIALSLGAFLGSLGMYLAFRHEMGDGQDTMPQLVAVLDTNFWLATHVTTVTIGYAAGLLAGFIAMCYLLRPLMDRILRPGLELLMRSSPARILLRPFIAPLLALKPADRAWYRRVARMVYGVLCFGLLFAVVGTILGGIWANDSWGRFWGWDPKENGALMICLWQLVILHGRMGGIFGSYGMCQAAVFGNIVVAFSWWGVNLLGVGLHSYGFTAGVQQTLYAFYGSQILVMLLGALGWKLATTRENALTEARAQPKGETPS